MLTNQTNLEQRRPQKELALWITDLLFGKKGLGSVKTIFVFFQKNFDSNIVKIGLTLEKYVSSISQPVI